MVSLEDALESALAKMVRDRRRIGGLRDGWRDDRTLGHGDVLRKERGGRRKVWRDDEVRTGLDPTVVDRAFDLDVDDAVGQDDVVGRAEGEAMTTRSLEEAWTVDARRIGIDRRRDDRIRDVAGDTGVNLAAPV